MATAPVLDQANGNIVLGDQFASTSIGSLYQFLSQHIAVTDDLHIEGCDGSLCLTARWFEQNEIDASSGLEWIKVHGPDCNCDCEIYSNLQAQFIGQESDRAIAEGG